MSDHDEDPTTDNNVIPIEQAKKRRLVAPPTPEAAPAPEPTPTNTPIVSEVDMLVGLVMTNATLFHDGGGLAHAQVAVSKHREVMRLDSKAFRSWFDALMFNTFRALPSASKRKEVLGVLDGLSRFASDRRRVHLRLAEHAGAVYLDLTNDAWESVKISSEGWVMVTDQPVMFRRSRSALPLPSPVSGGAIEELRPFANLPGREHDDAFYLLVAFLLATLRPTGPYTIAAICGEPGSAKTTTARVLRWLIDASKAPLRSLSKSERDMAVSAQHSWILAYDNLSGLTPAMSDSFCRVATGGGVSNREVFTDAEECVLEFARPVILNGIDDVATRVDLADRCVLVTLPRIPKERRVDEKVFWREFCEAAPRILGALLDGVVAGMRNVDSLVLPELPRMADFIRWVTACEPGIGWQPGTIAAAYERMRVHADADALALDPMARLILRLVTPPSPTEWKGEALELHRRLTAMADAATMRAPTWPVSEISVTGRLRRIAPILRSAGIDFTTRRASGGRRIITIFRTEPSQPSQPPPAEAPPQGHGTHGSDNRDGSDDRSGGTAAQADLPADAREVSDPAPTIESASSTAGPDPGGENDAQGPMDADSSGTVAPPAADLPQNPDAALPDASPIVQQLAARRLLEEDAAALLSKLLTERPDDWGLASLAGAAERIVAKDANQPETDEERARLRTFLSNYVRRLASEPKPGAEAEAVTPPPPGTTNKKRRGRTSGNRPGRTRHA